MQDFSPKNPSLYDADFYAWTHEQAALLRAGRFGEADIANIVEEIETLGRGEKRELVNRLAVLLMHLLKWRFQPDRRGRSWELTIKRQRIDLRDDMADNPSLKSKLPEAIATAFRLARVDAAQETGLELDVFPSVCPWGYDDMIDDAFWPES